MSPSRFPLLALAASLSLSCSHTRSDDDPLSATALPIIGGVQDDDAQAHESVVLLAVGDGACSGSLIAPNLVLTARHCVSHTIVNGISCDPYGDSGNGNHVVDYGFVNSAGYPWMVVVQSDQSVVMEVHYPVGYISYRAFNYMDLPWQLHRPAVTCRKIGAEYWLEAEEGHQEYRWSTGDTTAMIPIADTGNYWVFVPYGTGYISSEPIRITDPLTPCVFTGIPPGEEPGQGLSVLPNPASERFRAGFTLAVPSPVIFTLNDLTGKEVLRQELSRFPAGKHEVRLSFPVMRPGVYFLRMITHTGTETVKVVVR